jgi:hypothetical protein
MSTAKRKSRRRAQRCTPHPASTGHTPPLTDEQLRVLRQVYSIILSLAKPAGAA